jgi:hypothetical protein
LVFVFDFVFEAALIESAFLAESILLIVSIFIAVSIAVGVGAGAMAGVVVSAGVLSAFEQAATAKMAAARARRFMQFLLEKVGILHERCSSSQSFGAACNLGFQRWISRECALLTI